MFTVKQSHYRWVVFCSFILLSLLCFAPESQAQSANNFLDRMIEAYATNTHAWENTLRSYAIRLFWILAGIEFTWSAFKLAFKGADLSDFLGELLKQVMFIGFFYTLLLHSGEWATAIVDSFRQAGAAASTSVGGTGVIYPSNVLDAGMSILKKISENMSIWDLGDSTLLALAAIVILIGFACISALLVIALVESYFVISAGVLLMGFGGSRWTSDFALNTLKYAVSVGAKLFMVQLVISLGQQLINEWADSASSSNMDLDDVLMIAAVCLVFTAITKVIPEMVQGLINGSSLSNGNQLNAMAVGAAAAAGAAAASVATGGAGLSSAIGGAYKLAGEQAKESGKPPEGSKLTRFAALTGPAAKNLKQASAHNLGQRFRGEVRMGNMGAQMGHHMQQQAESLKIMREKSETSATSATSAPPNRIYGLDPKDEN